MEIPEYWNQDSATLAKNCSHRIELSKQKVYVFCRWCSWKGGTTETLQGLAKFMMIPKHRKRNSGFNVFSAGVCSFVLINPCYIPNFPFVIRMFTMCHYKTEIGNLLFKRCKQFRDIELLKIIVISKVRLNKCYNNYKPLQTR